MNIQEIAKKIMFAIAPFCENYLANKMIRKKLDSENETAQLQTVLSASNAPERITTEDLHKLYIKDLENKDKLEDKAKATIMCVTISISLILGASNLLSSISKLYSSDLINWSVFVLFCFSVIFMISAAIMDIKVLAAENMSYIEQPDWNDEERRQGLDDCIARNRLKNLIRNNYIYTAYKNIRNALICLFIIMLISTLPLNNHNTDNEVKGSHLSFSFSDTIIDSSSDEDRIAIKSIINKAIQENSIDEGIPYTLIDKDYGKYVKFIIHNDIITILNSETIAIAQ